ncbi:MAG: hypothetical protein C4530_24145 [Desulfobacteraceae bacterium]|nr:MAG: hypothetical protein C4530_24145 [Desulfobacteraceae bacterium]
MATLFTNSNGRLRIGRVTILVFFLLLLIMGAFFKIQKPVDDVIVKVKHVFEPPRQPEKSPSVVADTPAQNPEEPQKAIAKKLPDPQTEPGAAASTPDSQSGKPQQEDPASNKPLPAEVTPQPPPAPDYDVPKPQEKTEAVAFLSQPEGKAEVPIKPEKTDAPPESDQKRTDLDVSDKLNKTLSKADEAAKTEQPIDLSDASRLLEKFNEKPKVQQQQTTSPNLKIELPKKSESLADKGRKSENPSLQKPRSDAREGSVTVSSDQYLKVFNGWRTAGQSDLKENGFGLRVENLREAYSLFQMKPVAVVENRFYDLSDGSRIPEKSLEAFSTTAFRVSEPWEKWGDALSSSGIKKSEKIDVRYYMYDFIRNAIYTRAHRAVSWCKDKGLIEADMPHSDLDVLGRAFVIKKEGGGKFGVFVPVTLNTRNGKTIPIDSACFSDQPDVQMLKSVGLL